MAVLLMILLMISPISCILMLYRQFKAEKDIQRIKEDVSSIQDICFNISSKVNRKDKPIEVDIQNI